MPTIQNMLNFCMPSTESVQLLFKHQFHSLWFDQGWKLLSYSLNVTMQKITLWSS